MPSRLVPWLSAAALAAGCGAEATLPAPIAEEPAPLVDTSGPVATAAVWAPMPALPSASGKFLESAVTAAGPDAIHAGVYTDGRDTGGGATGSVSAWTAAVADQPYTAAPSFHQHLAGATGAAAAHAATLDGSVLTKIKQALQLFPNAPQPMLDPPTVRFQGSAPVRGRWVNRQYIPNQSTDTGLFGGAEQLTSYADPTHFAELRERGARLYCAAREAQAHQSSATRSLGESVGFSVKLLGKKIDFGVVEPTFVLEDPRPDYAPGSDGAQAFSVPMRFGVQITPVRGLGLPGFPEVRYPVALVTGDSEVQTEADPRAVKTGQKLQCLPGLSGLPKCTLVPTTQTKLARRHTTVTHGDAVYTADEGIHGSSSFPIFSIGILTVNATLGLGLDLGKLEPAQNDRALAYAQWSLPPHRTGTITGLYDDGYWLLTETWRGMRYFFEVMSESPAAQKHVELVPGQPLLTRILENDERHVRTKTSMSLSAGLSGEIGKDLGPLAILLTASGTLTGTVGLRHELRDGPVALLEGGGVRPAAGLTIAPSTTASASLDGLVNLHLELDVWFKSWKKDIQLAKLGPVPLASYDSGLWPEANRVRIGTSAEGGADPMRHPVVTSTMPGAGTFSSIPSGVDACLATPPAHIPPPAECPAESDTGVAPQAQVCFYANERNGNVCANVGAYVAASYNPGPLAECMKSALTFVCQPVGKEQVWKGLTVRSRVIDLGNVPLGTDLGNILQQCINAATASSPSEEQAQVEGSAFFDRSFGFGTCDATGKLLTDAQVAGPAGIPTQAPAVTAGNCK